MTQDELASLATKLGALVAPLVAKQVDDRLAVLFNKLAPTVTELVNVRLKAVIPEVTTGFAIAFYVVVAALRSADVLDYGEITRALEAGLRVRSLKDQHGNVGRIVRELIELLATSDGPHFSH